MELGFIGTGSMGAAMVPHLVAAGHRVGVWNRNADASRALAGVVVLATPAAAFDNDVVFSMLSDDAAVRGVIVDSGALDGARAGCVHVMMSTISPALVDELQQRHRQAGVGYVAAPVFGVPSVAAAAQLNILVAGEAAAVARVSPLLDLLGRRTWPLGDDPKHANIAKIAGNLMITLAIEAMGEATALTERYGLETHRFLDVVTNTLFASPSYQRYAGLISSKRYDPGFKLTLGLKDVDLALAAASDAGVSLPAAEIVRQNMQTAVSQGLGGRDWSVLAQATRQRAGLGDDIA